MQGKKFILADSGDIKPGDIVKYSPADKPESNGVCYFVLHTESSVLKMRNVITCNEVCYDINEQKFHF